MSAPERIFYDEAQANRWLAWLAHAMRRNDQTVFLIENLQPSWLETRSEVWAFSLLTRTVWGLWAGLFFALNIGLFIGLGAREMIEGPLSFGLILGLLCGLIAGLLDARKLCNRASSAEVKGDTNNRRYVVSILRVGLLVWLLIGGLTIVLSSFTSQTPDAETSKGLVAGLSDMVDSGPIAAPVFSLIFALIVTSRSTFRTASNEIRPVETITWSHSAALRSAGQGVAVGLVIGLLLGIVFALLWPEDWIVFIAVGISFGLVYGLFFGLLGGITPVVRDLKTEPNQGIRLSARNALRIGGSGGLLFALTVGIIGLTNGQSGDLFLWGGIAYGVLAAFTLGGWFGGIDVAEHAILRFILTHKNYAPRNYARFLDYAAGELHFLQKVGGGYIFVHRYLLEYFAAQYATPAPPAEAATLETLPG